MTQNSRLRGWLSNPERKLRRDTVNTLTDKQVGELIESVGSIDRYTRLKPELDFLIRKRDQALIALGWIFFKRGKEDLRIRLSDIYYDEKELSVTFRVQKKRKTVLECPNCMELNGRKSSFCRKCGTILTEAMIIQKGGGETTKIKNKNRSFKFCQYVVDWIDIVKAKTGSSESNLFPPYSIFSQTLEYDKHLTIQRLDQILQRLDSTMTSSMFRYGGTEKYLRLGYTPTELKEIGDWLSSHMPEIYAERKGLSPIQKKFGEDIRETE